MRSSVLNIMDFTPRKRATFEKFLVSMAQGLHESGCSVHFIFCGEPVDWFKEAIAAHATFSCVDGSPLAGRNFLKTLRTVWTLRPAALSFWFLSMFSPFSLLLARLPRVRHSIFADHISGTVSEKHGLKLLLAKLRGRVASWCYDVVVSISEYNRRRNVSESFISAGRTKVIYNGVEAGWTGSPEARVSTRSATPYLFYAGQLIREKGVWTLIRAFSLFLQGRPGGNIELWLAGEGPEAEGLRSETERLGIAHDVRFLGQRDDVPELMAGAAASVIPSEWPEAFGLTAAEAMASGKPVIVSDAGALPEVVGDCGMIFPKGDARELAALLAKAADPHADLAEMTARARSRVQQVFSLDRMAEDYIELFQHVLNGAR